MSDDILPSPTAFESERLLAERLRTVARTDEPVAWAEIQAELGNLRLDRALATSDPETLAEAESSFRAALDLSPTEMTEEWRSGGLGPAQLGLADLLLVRGRITEDVLLLEEAVKYARAAREVGTRDRAATFWTLTTQCLAEGLAAVGLLLGEESHFVEADSLLRAILESSDPVRSVEENANLHERRARLLLGHASISRQADLYAEAVRAATAAVEATSQFKQAGEWLSRQKTLANALAGLAALSVDPSLLSRTERAQLALLDAIPRREQPGEWAKVQYGLAQTLLLTAQRGRDLSALVRAEEAHRRALEIGGSALTPNERRQILNDCAFALLERAQWTRDPRPLPEAEALLQQALKGLAPGESPKLWDACHATLGSVLFTYGDIASEDSALLAAENVYQRVYEVLGEPGAGGGVLEYLEIVRSRRIALHHDLAIDALLLERHATNSVQSERSSARADAFEERGDVAVAYSQDLGDPAPFGNAFAAYGAALDLVPEASDPERWGVLVRKLGTALRQCGHATEHPGPLVAAVAAFRASLRVSQPYSRREEWAEIHRQIGEILVMRTEMTGEIDLIDEIERTYRVVLDTHSTATAPADRLAVWSEIARVRELCATITGDPYAMEAAESALQTALEATPTEDAWRTGQIRGKLAGLLRSRAERSGERADFERAEAAFREILATALGAGSEYQTTDAHLDLARFLRSWTDRTREIEPLVRAEDEVGKALGIALTMRGDWLRVDVNVELGRLCALRVELTGKTAARTAADLAYRTALEALDADDDARRVEIQGLRAALLVRSGVQTKERSAIDAATRLYREILRPYGSDGRIPDPYWSWTQATYPAYVEQVSALLGDSTLSEETERVSRLAHAAKIRVEKAPDWARTAIVLANELRNLKAEEPTLLGEAVELEAWAKEILAREPQIPSLDFAGLWPQTEVAPPTEVPLAPVVEIIPPEPEPEPEQLIERPVALEEPDPPKKRRFPWLPFR